MLEYGFYVTNYANNLVMSILSLSLSLSLMVLCYTLIICWSAIDYSSLSHPILRSQEELLICFRIRRRPIPTSGIRACVVAFLVVSIKNSSSGVLKILVVHGRQSTTRLFLQERNVTKSALHCSRSPSVCDRSR